MSIRFDIPGVYWVPGKLLRGRLINGDDGSNVAELALTETTLAGGTSMYSGTSSIANPPDSAAAPYRIQVRQVTAQTTASFNDTATAQGVVPPSDLGYIVGGFFVAQLPGAKLSLTHWAGGLIPAPNFTGQPIVDLGRLRKLVTAQGGSLSTITFDAAALSTNQYYRGYRVVIPDGYGGLGAGQSRIVTDYNGATKVATIFPNWTVAPDNTTSFYLESASSDLQMIVSNTNATTLTAGLLNVNLTGSIVRPIQITVREVTIDAD